jgi:hypothetical protein
MTIYYVDSHGSNTAPYDTWAKAANLLATIAAIDAAGDTIYVAHNHAETTNVGNTTLAWAGTVASPSSIICGNSGAAPPTTIAATATLTTTAGGAVINAASNAAAGCSYTYGITFINNSPSGSGRSITLTSNSAGSFNRFEACSFQLPNTDTTGRIGFGGAANGAVELVNCTFQFGDATQAINGGAGFLHIQGGSLLAGGTSPTALLKTTTGLTALIEGFDLSNASASINLCATAAQNCRITFRNCKLPSSWSGVLNSSAPAVDGHFILDNTDSSNTNYRLWMKNPYGEITSETTLIKTGGANDGTTGLSWKFVSTADAKFQNPLLSHEIVRWNDLTGSALTVDVDILHDSATNLKDDEVWLEVQYLSSSGTPLGTFVNDAKANILATGADQTASSATWTTTGMANPNKQKLSVTFTPQMKGFIHAVVKVGKASYTLYVDPKLTVS